MKLTLGRIAEQRRVASEVRQVKGGGLDPESEEALNEERERERPPIDFVRQRLRRHPNTA